MSLNAERSAGRSKSAVLRIGAASFIGTAVEYYDFFIYSTAAALVFGKLFFPSGSAVAGTLAAFATFAAGFLVRPLGGVIFGHFGDRVGRKKMLILSLFFMGGSTVLIGLLPTFTTAGAWAPIALVVVRIVQGLAVGGEWGAAVLMAVEHGPQNRRGLHGSWAQAGAPAGSVLATGAFAAVSWLPDDQLMSWGWRIPFLASAVLLVVGILVRLRVAESPVFAEVSQTKELPKIPVLVAVRRYPGNVIKGFAVCVAPTILFYLLSTFGLQYATKTLHIERGTVLLVLTIASIMQTVAVVLFALLSDHIGRKLVFASGAAAMSVFGVLYFTVNNGSLVVFAATVIAGLLIHASMYGPLGALFTEMFPPEVRYSGASLGYQVGNLLGGGFAPLVLTALFAADSGGATLATMYVVGAALITIAGSVTAKLGKTALATEPQSTAPGI
ncbi:MFS transporter [Amycolatopsis alkalitolerans]|uniref:Putative proline/betaine transporter n=1 Tax=Amycolatopsis alkalitolerans TaxID=2547244 RepID=A0A5C4M7J9_9PSEU|nr:MFS transporter [Amycolatopsis alkalitolerans]TNC29438.1 MHS family MFS transporter [Amycolatopsis alkalitolerans]